MVAEANEQAIWDIAHLSRKDCLLFKEILLDKMSS